MTIFKGGKELITTPFTPNSISSRNHNSRNHSGDPKFSARDKFQFFNNHHNNKRAKDYNKNIIYATTL